MDLELVVKDGYERDIVDKGSGRPLIGLVQTGAVYDQSLYLLGLIKDVVKNHIMAQKDCQIGKTRCRLQRRLESMLHKG
jgi:hypothetical protein